MQVTFHSVQQWRPNHPPTHLVELLHVLLHNLQHLCTAASLLQAFADSSADFIEGPWPLLWSALALLLCIFSSWRLGLGLHKLLPCCVIG